MSGKTYVVAQRHPCASDGNDGTTERPLRTINRAAELAGPGDVVLVREGIYRERVNPRRGGQPSKPIVYMAAPGEEVCIRGSEVFRPAWQPVPGLDGVYRGALDAAPLGLEAYGGQADEELYKDFNPYVLGFNRAEKARPSKGPVFPLTLGQVFSDGRPLLEVQTFEDLREIPGTWMVSPEGDAVLVHFPKDCTPDGHLVELSVRHTVFSPLQRGLGYIHVKGFIIEHGANHFPTWGKGGWAQAGLLSTRSGHHWLIEGNIVRYAKGIGIDCGLEGVEERMERPGKPGWSLHELAKAGLEGREWPEEAPGRHLVRDNLICDNGHCGIAGIGHWGTRVVGNVIERNNRSGWTSPWWEFAGIKFHFFFGGLIEGNLIRDNDAHGIWLDNQWRYSRVTRNVIVNNLWSGINVELGRGPLLIDNNVVAYTRQGDGIYGHDVADVTIAHNLIYANANFGLWFAYCTKRVRNEDGCWDIKAFNNMILGNRAGAVAYPIPWECAGNNRSDGNLLMGAGEYLDEGSGPNPPLFQFNNKSHCGQFPEHCGARVPMTKENTLALFKKSLEEAGIPKDEWPNLDWWQEHYYVPLGIWRKVLGNDLRSRVMRAIRDGLQSRLVSWEMDFDATLGQVECAPVPGVDKDFFGRPMPAERPLPGPFQGLKEGRNRIVLWPVRGVPTRWLLG